MPYGMIQFRQDLKQVKRLLDDQDYELINILGNRITSNAFLLSGSNFSIPGFMIKDLAVLIGPRKQMPNGQSLISSATSSFKLFVTKLDEIDFGSEEGDLKLWEIYLTTLKLMRKSLAPEDEYEIYSIEDPSLTREGLLKLIEIIKENTDTLLKTDGRMILSIITEVNRLYAAYGIDIQIAKLRLLFIVLGQINNYFNKQSLENTVSESDENMVITFLNRIIHLAHSEMDVSLKALDELLTQMIISWRELFIRYNEPFEIREEKNSELPLPPEIKGKLRDLIARNLEKDIKKAK